MNEKKNVVKTNRSRVIAEFEKNKGIMAPIYANVINRYNLIGANNTEILNIVSDIAESKMTPIGFFAAVRKKDGGITVTMSKCRVSDYMWDCDLEYGRDLVRMYALRGEGIPENQINDKLIESDKHIIYMFNTEVGTIKDQYNKFLHRVCSYYKDAPIKLALI